MSLLPQLEKNVKFLEKAMLRVEPLHHSLIEARRKMMRMMSLKALNSKGLKASRIRDLGL
jgi:hypothetical protein